jgi:hypothetical protein
MEDESRPLTEEDLEVKDKLYSTEFLIKGTDVPHLLENLASEHLYKAELAQSEHHRELLIKKIGPGRRKDLEEFINKYEDGLDKGKRYSVWITFFPVAYPREWSIQFQECEVFLDSTKAPRGYLRYCYLYKDPTKEHECIFRNDPYIDAELIDTHVKPRCEHAGTVLKKYLRHNPLVKRVDKNQKRKL